MIIFGTADSLGCAAMTGMVGHSGRFGCRLSCDMPSRRRTGDSHYYPAMNCPDEYAVVNCTHPDVTDADLLNFRSHLPQKYSENINFLLHAQSQAEYRQCQLALGLCKQTLFSGLPFQPLPVPTNFTLDIMHLSVLNHPDLFMKLFTGKLDVYDSDDRLNWDWAVFYQNNTLWEGHGKSVAMCSSYIPSSFGRTPRNPALKINSGYKAWEYQLYFYGLGPVLFRHILPYKYWVNFCKLVSGIRLLQRHSMTHEDIIQGNNILIDFVHEFETLYYQWMESRIHFVHQSIHLLTHIGPETLRAGPLACYAQWTLETAIGNLGCEIRQDRDLYANLTQQAILRAQVNSLHARYPALILDLTPNLDSTLPSGAHEFTESKGYIFLPHCEDKPSPLTPDELHALRVHWCDEAWPNNIDSWINGVCRWPRLKLPNGQRVRSLWYESRCVGKTRRTTCVEVSHILLSIYNFNPLLLHRYHTKVTFELQKYSFTFA